MRIVGITRVRNEEQVIGNTLNHVSSFVDEVLVFDDCSLDDTVRICSEHPIVSQVLQGKNWSPDPKERNGLEGKHRQILYELAGQRGADFVYCFDADEYIYPEKIDFTADCYFFRLFDFYITKEDHTKPYLERRWMGPEYRDIPMLFKVHPWLKFTQRIPRNYGVPVFGGYVKHYGKAISIEEWEAACVYYTNFRWKGINEKLYNRWQARKGKAIHSLSDFGRPLIQWNERTTKAIKLND